VEFEAMSTATDASDRRVRDFGLILLDEACRRAALYAKPIERVERVPIVDAINRVLAEEIRANIALPPFDQSAMDGYAFAAASIERIETELPVTVRVAAGSRAAALPAGSAARIFTGSAIPAGADTVVMQEHVRRRGAHVVVDGPVRSGSNIRRRGEDIAAGEVLLDAGQRLGPHHIALLAAQGIVDVCVRHVPRVVIASTGDELRQPGEPLGEASIYDSNRPMLLALARQAGLVIVDGGCIPDNRVAIANRLADFADTADLIVTTGGASVGEADHSAAALATADAPFEVLKMAVKPGKPAVVGHLSRAAYLGLPGNPVAALVSWLTLGGAMIAALSGTTWRRRRGSLVAVVSTFERGPGRNEFVPARLVATDRGTRLEILGRGGSARLKPLIHADGLAEIDVDAGTIEPGDSVQFHSFRDGFGS
jgi:molybdopterin molybdotransferase